MLGGTLGFTRAPGENVGTYPVTPNGLTSGNYTITFNPGNLTISRAALSITADPKTKTYGAADPTFTVTYAGFVNSETAAVLGGSLGFTRAPGENVGTYAVTPNGLTSGNYTITFSPGNLTITRAALSVTADNKTKTYGAADPAFTVAYVGFVNSETAAVLGGTLGFNRAPGENVGTYAVTPNGLTSGNYTITFIPGTLTITPPAVGPTLLSLKGAGTSNVVITWTAVSNVTYRVEYKTDLNAGTWSALPGDVLASGNLASKVDGDAVSIRFYRILVVH